MLWSIPVNKPLGPGPQQVPGRRAAPGSQPRCCCPVPSRLGWAVPALPALWDPRRVLLAVSHGGWREQLATPAWLSLSSRSSHDYTREATGVDLGRDLLAGGGKGRTLQLYLTTLSGKLVTGEERVGVSAVTLSLICINR